MMRVGGIALAALGVVAWGAALWLTYSISMGETSAPMLAVLPILGVSGDILVVCGLAMVGLPALVRRRQAMMARVRKLLG
jgi:hypothetical protein